MPSSSYFLNKNSSIIHNNIPPNEWNILQDFYQSTNGKYWDFEKTHTNSTHWNFTHYPTNNPCYDKWVGIICTCHHYPHADYYMYGYYSNNNLVKKCNIQKLVLVNFNLTGTIISKIGSFPNLTVLIIRQNELYGSVPTELGLLKNLKNISFAINKLTGTIPTSIGNLNQLQYVDFSSNFFTGTIPSSIKFLNKLKILNLGHNHLTGTISSIIGNINNIYYLELNSNFLTGVIPSSIGNLHQLKYLDFYNNLLSGSIPISLGNLNNLQYFIFYSNFLTGVIPWTFEKLSQLLYLILGTNFLTGTIPSFIRNLNKLQYLYLSENMLTSTIPSIIGNFNKNLQYLSIHDNYLTGTIPSSLRHLPLLVGIFLYSNKLIGPISNVFNSSIQGNLRSIQLNNNQLTGSIPKEVFKLPQLIAFDIATNCFFGDIPYSTICKSHTLNSLILNGLHTSTSCRQFIFPGSSLFSSSYILSSNLFNRINTCIFLMDSLATLHLAGNGLTGSLPNNINNISDNLTDLSLSHNLFTGTIPNSFQYKKWKNLDLSFNRITGTLLPEFANQRSDSSLYLQQNRLSGNVPISLYGVRNISVLSGNIFGCDLTKSDIPQYDSDISNYKCGSNSFDIPYYIWMTIVFFVIIYVLILKEIYRRNINNNNFNSIRIMYFYGEDFLKSIFFIKYLGSHSISNKSIMTVKLFVLMKIIFYLVIYIVTVMLIIYIMSGVYYGIYTYEYAWTVSLAFQSGRVAFGFIFSGLCLLVSLLLFLITRQNIFQLNEKSLQIFNNQIIGDDNQSIHKTESITNSFQCFKKILNFTQFLNFLSSLSWTITPFVNVIVVGGVNILYVFLFLNLSSNAIVIIQILLAVFKSFWSAIGYRYLRKFIDSRFNVNNNSKRYSFLQLFVRLLNNIIIPCVVVAIINNDCFYNLFVPAPPVTTTFEYKVCDEVNYKDSCDLYRYQRQIATFDPPFNYSYQCSSRFITYYAPTFVFLCIIDGFLANFVQFMFFQLYNYGITNGKNWVVWFDYLKIMMPDIMKINQIDNHNKVKRAKLDPYFDSLELFLNNFTYLGLLMTFGAVFPPLAASFFVTIYLMNFVTFFKLDRFVNYAKEKDRLEVIDMIEKECEGCFDNILVIRSVWMIIIISCLFYSLFLFDTLGDDVGLSGSYWVLIVMTIMPFVIYVVYEMTVVRIERNNSNIEKEKEIEITNVQNPIRESDLFVITIS